MITAQHTQSLQRIGLMQHKKPIAANNVPANAIKSVYPEPFASKMDGRIKKKLGDHFGLENFGINLTELSPNAISALKHCHAKQDEFIYILTGTPTLNYGNEAFLLEPGDCFGFKAGENIAHQLINHSSETVLYLEIGDRSSGDTVVYPDDDIAANFQNDSSWRFTHKDGTSY